MADPGLLALMEPTSGVKACMAAGLRLMSVAALLPTGVPLPARLPATSFSQSGLSVMALDRPFYTKLDLTQPGMLSMLDEYLPPGLDRLLCMHTGLTLACGAGLRLCVACWAPC